MTTIEAEKILGLNCHYDKEILKSTYRNKVVKFHPDNCKINGLTEEEATKKFNIIKEAFDLLSKNVNNKNHYSSANNTNYKSQSDGFVDVRDYTNAVAAMLSGQVKSDNVVLKKLMSRFVSFNPDIWDMCFSYMNSLYSQIKYFNITFGANIDSIINQNEVYITQRRELLYDINQLFWNNYYTSVLHSFRLKDDIQNFIKEKDFFRDRINFVSLSTWGDDIFTAVDEVENAIKSDFKRSALRRIKSIISSYSDRKYYSVLKEYLNNLGILTFNSLNLENIPLEGVNNFITARLEELNHEIEKTFINYTIFKIKEKISNFVFGNTDILNVYDDKSKTYSYLKTKRKKRNFTNKNKDIS